MRHQKTDTEPNPVRTSPGPEAALRDGDLRDGREGRVLVRDEADPVASIRFLDPHGSKSIHAGERIAEACARSGDRHAPEARGMASGEAPPHGLSSPVPPCDDPASAKRGARPVSAIRTGVHIPPMSFQEIHDALRAAEVVPDDRFAAIEPRAARVAFEMLAAVTGLPLAAIDVPPPGLSERFPKTAVPEDAARLFGGDRTRYQAWRRQLLDASMLAMRVPVDSDPWDGLRRVARLAHGKLKANLLYNLGKHFPDTAPAAMTLAQAIEIECGLSGAERASFRNGWSVVASLQDDPLATDIGVLPERLDPLPAPSRLNPHLPLPPKLGAVAGAVLDETAATWCWTLAVAAGIVKADADPEPATAFSPEAWKRLTKVDPGSHGVDLSMSTFAIYRGRFARTLIAAGAADPRMNPVEAAWRRLTRAGKLLGRSGTFLSAVTPQAKADGLRPRDLTGEWFISQIAAAPTKRRSNAIRNCACHLDRLRDEPGVPGALLPARPIGLDPARRPKAPTPPKPAMPPVERAWIDFFAAARRAGASVADLNCLSALRAAAIPRGLRPRDIDRAWMESARAAMSRSQVCKLHTAARVLDALRDDRRLSKHLPSSPIGALADHRRSAGDLPAPIAAELAALLDGQGVAPSTRRSASIAVKALFEAGDPAADLGDLLNRDLSALDRGRNHANAARHKPVLVRLREYLALPWTDAWRALQIAVSAAGVRPADNPVAALLRHADGRAPGALDASWAGAVNRKLRRAGRADLALTFGANLRRLDALHDVPILVATGLLPPRF